MVDDFFSRLAGLDMVENENYIYFYDNEKGLLCEIEKKTRKNRILAEFEKDLSNTYSCIDIIEQKLVLTPWGADTILVYDLENESIFEFFVNLPKVGFTEKYRENQKFWDSVCFGNCIYLLGYSYPIIIKFDVITFQIEYLTEWYTQIINRCNKSVNTYLVHGEVVESNVWISCGCCNVMLKLNLLNNKFEYFEVPLIESGCGVFTFDGENFWIGEWEKNYQNLICWNPYNRKSKVIQTIKDTNEKWCPHRSIISYEDYLLVFPFVNNVITKIEKDSGVITESIINSYCGTKIYNKKGWKIVSVICSEENLKFVTGDYLWHEYNLKNYRHTSYEILNTDTVLLKKYVTKHMNQQNSIYEENGLLYIFLKYVLSLD